MRRGAKALWFVAVPIAAVLGVAALAVALRWLLVALNVYNPMQAAFLAHFDVANESGVRVRVTPIGMWEGSGRYGPLPRYGDQHPPAVPSSQTHAIPLVPGESVRITYDWDDINFRHILVTTEAGDCYILDTDRRGTLGACYGPQKARYAIPPLGQLARAPAELLPCTTGARVAYSGAKEYP